MAKRPRYTVADVIRSYRGKSREELYGEWGAAILYRRISFLLTPLFLNAAIGATTVTMLALAIAVALPLMAVWGGSYGYVYVALGGVAFAVLDCVDGNIARTADTRSELGGYADFIVDVVYRSTLYGAIGLIVGATSAAPAWLAEHALALGLGAALLAISARLSRVYVENRMAEENPYAASASAGAGLPARVVRLLFPFVSGLDPLLPLFVLALGAFGVLHWLLIWLLAYSALDFLYTQAAIVGRLR